MTIARSHIPVSSLFSYRRYPHILQHIPAGARPWVAVLKAMAGWLVGSAAFVALVSLLLLAGPQ